MSSAVSVRKVQEKLRKFSGHGLRISLTTHVKREQTLEYWSFRLETLSHRSDHRGTAIRYQALELGSDLGGVIKGLSKAMDNG